MTSFVFDSNTLISALLNDSSTPAKALIKARAIGVLLISKEVAAEYFEVFSRPKFDKYVPETLRMEFLENIISNALPVLVQEEKQYCRDPRDDKFLSLALEGKTKCIVTGDNDLLVLHPFIGIPILNPSDFLLLY